MGKRIYLSKRVTLSLLTLVLSLTLLVSVFKTSVVNADQGVAVLGEHPLQAFSVFKGNPLPQSQIVTLTSQPFTQALELRTFAAPASPYFDGEYSMSVSAYTSAPITQGDQIVVSFWVRSVEPVNAQAYASLQFEGTTNYEKSLSTFIKADPTWRQFQYAFKAVKSYGSGEAQLTFWLGYGQQVFQIAGLSLLNYGSGTVANLPQPTYEGREANAAWRQGANERIEQIRKGNLTVTVRDSAGSAVPGATVEVKMLKHAFGFGSALDAGLLRASTEDGQKYRDKFKALFNKAVLADDLKWSEWEDTQRRQLLSLPALQWLKDNGYPVRGHNLVWPGWGYLPGNVYNLRGDAPALKNRIDTHISDEATNLRGWLDEWDVLNEPYANHDLMDILGTGEMANWFKSAKLADPNTKLYINDYDILELSGWNVRHQNHYYTTIQNLLAQGAPLNGIGIQGHFTEGLTSPSDMLAILDRFSGFGLPIQITEFDVDIKDEQLQADYSRDFLTTLFSHPNVNSIVQWGFWEGNHWRPDAALYRQDWSIKPNGQAYLDLVFNQWWTNSQGTTNGSGQYTVRGFMGDYEVTVTFANGISKKYTVSLPNAGTTLNVVADGMGVSTRTNPTNLVLNAGFEDATTAWNDRGGSATLITSAQAGSRALQIGPGAGGRVQNLLDFKPGTSYLLTGWGKLSGPGDNCWIGVRGGPQVGLTKFTYTLNFANERNFTQRVLAFTPPSGTGWLQVFVWKNSGPGNVTCSADEISLTPTIGTPPPTPAPPAVTPNLPNEPNQLLNEDFEGGISSWFAFGPAVIAPVTSTVYTGSKALLVSNRTDSWQGVAQRITGKVGSGGYYRSSVRLRLGSGAPPTQGRVTLKLVTTDGTQNIQMAAGNITGDTWTLLSDVTAVNWTGTLQNAEWYVSTASGSADIFVDSAEFTPIPTLPPDVNVLSNGGGEEATTGWYAFGPVTLSASTSQIYAGTNSLLVANRTASWQGIAQNITTKVINGGTYRSSVWLRLGPGAANANGVVNLKIVSSAGTQYLTVSTGQVTSTEWKQLNGIANVTWDGTLQAVEWYISTDSGTSDFFMDNALFGIAGSLPPDPNVVRNGGFEQGNSYWYGYGPVTLTTTTNLVYSGTVALVVSNRTASWQGVAQDITAQVTTNTLYYSSVWVRLASGADPITARVALKLTTSSGAQEIPFGNAPVADGVWSQIVGSGVVSWTGTLQKAEWHISTDGGTAGLLVDNAEFGVGSSSNTPLKSISPVLECVVAGSDGTYTAYYGYNNPNPFGVVIGLGNATNYFNPNPKDRGQPFTFLPRRVRSVFKISFNSGNQVWLLNGRTSTASPNSARCP